MAASERDELVAPSSLSLDSSLLIAPPPSPQEVLVRLSSHVFFPTLSRRNELLRPTKRHHNCVFRLPLPRGRDTTVEELRASLLARLGAGVHELLQRPCCLNDEMAHPLHPFAVDSGDPGAFPIMSGALAPALGRTRGGELRCAVTLTWLPSPVQWREWRRELFAAERRFASRSEGGAGCGNCGDCSNAGPELCVILPLLLVMWCLCEALRGIWKKRDLEAELEPPGEFFGHLDDEGAPR